jgi:hypothetical protein
MKNKDLIIIVLGCVFFYSLFINTGIGLAYGQLTTTKPDLSLGNGTTLSGPGSIIEGNKTEPIRWLTYNDPILQFTIEYPSTWDINQNEDIVSFAIPDTYSDFDVIVEPLLTLDHRICT